MNGRIKGKYRYFGRIDCNIDDVAFALGRNKTLIIQLKDGRTHTITGIENAWQLASTIRYNMPFDVNEQSDVLIKKLAYLKSSKKNGLIYVLYGSALMFVIIFIMIFLIGERELYEFVKNDWMITAILGLAWIAAFVTTFHFFKIIEKNNISIERLKYHIQRTVVEAHPLLPGNVIKVLSDENYVGRITVFGYPNDNSVYYTVEQFTSDYTLFKSYESEIFDNVEQLRELLEAMIDITEKVLH